MEGRYTQAAKRTRQDGEGIQDAADGEGIQDAADDGWEHDNSPKRVGADKSMTNAT
jgi:hypothetical protein